ncbi:MAG: hypothetical protein H0Z38_08160 [Firmicutes bacterium]|nr:hypothetical protein [Bacillota bacterium]
MKHQDGYDGHWLIPEGDREAFIHPALKDWGTVLAENHQLLESEKLKERRQSLRRRVYQEALSYTREVLGEEEVAQTWADRSVDQSFFLVSGHQPRFYHPGVWAKNFLLSTAVAEAQAIPINLIVDTDEVGSLGVELPVKRGTWSVEKISLAETVPGSTFETVAAPKPRVIRSFSEKLSALPTAGYRPETVRAKSRFTEALESMLEADVQPPSLAAWLTILRRRCEGEKAAYLELPVSRLAELPEFKGFAGEVITQAAEFTKQYNLTLQRYRKEHGYRYRVNPFPDLFRDEQAGRYELPFWISHQGTRVPAYVVVENSGKIRLLAGEAEVKVFNSEVWAEDLAEVALRPRGMTLTLFVRLFCADLFLHGIGGAKYDGATDAFIRDYLGLTPPIYAGATLTLFPALEVPKVTHQDLVEQEELIRDVEYNPDRHLKDAGLAKAEITRLRELVSKKQELIEKIKEPGVDKKTLGLEIKGINKQIGESLSSYRQKLEEKLESDRKLYQERELVMRRDFPYFLFDADLVSRLVTGEEAD